MKRPGSPSTSSSCRRDLWPRDELNEERIELFVEHFQADEELDPVVVLLHHDGKYGLVDGNHRVQAALRAGRNDVRAVIISPRTNETPDACAYRVALETATRSSLPLSKAERRRAVLKLRGAN